jgi:hypothetical protein
MPSPEAKPADEGSRVAHPPLASYVRHVAVRRIAATSPPLANVCVMPVRVLLAAAPPSISRMNPPSALGPVAQCRSRHGDRLAAAALSAAQLSAFTSCGHSAVNAYARCVPKPVLSRCSKNS